MADPDAPGDAPPASVRFWFPARLAKFFIPLPDPLPLRERYTYMRTEFQEPQKLEALVRAGAAVEVTSARWLEFLIRTAATAVAGDTDGDEADPAVTPGVYQRSRGGIRANARAFVSLIRVWQEAWASSEASGPIRAIERAYARSASDVPDHPSHQRGGNTDFEVPAVDVTTTILEVIVPFHRARDDSDPASDAFDSALQVAQHVQRSLYDVRRIPTRLASRQLMPIALPFEVADVVADSERYDLPVTAWHGSLMMLHDNLKYRVAQTPLTPEEDSILEQAQWGHLASRPFGSYLDLRREAMVAFERAGDLRTSSIWLGAAAEYLVDELLRHLMWACGMRPEEALKPFEDRSITARVRRNLSSFLGGQWDLVRPGPATAWKTKVADLRNAVVHRNYEPEFDEVLAAIEASESFLHYIGDRLVVQLNDRFRTAMALLGTPGIEARKAMKRYARVSARTARFEPDWELHFARWRAVHEKLLDDPDQGEQSAADPMEHGLNFVYGRRNCGYWMLSDYSTNRAMRVNVDELSLTSDVLAAITSLLDGEQAPERGGPRARKIRFGPDVSWQAAGGHWVESYRLDPEMSLMVDFTDIEDDEFSWRPSVSMHNS